MHSSVWKSIELKVGVLTVIPIEQTSHVIYLQVRDVNPQVPKHVDWRGSFVN